MKISKTSLCAHTKNGSVVAHFVIVRPIRRKLQLTVSFDHPVQRVLIVDWNTFIVFQSGKVNFRDTTFLADCWLETHWFDLNRPHCSTVPSQVAKPSCRQVNSFFVWRYIGFGCIDTNYILHRIELCISDRWVVQLTYIGCIGTNYIYMECISGSQAAVPCLSVHNLCQGASQGG